jgi:hypothetical protein
MAVQATVTVEPDGSETALASLAALWPADWAPT